jgi:broad specificity phosphatase PhoE
MNLDIYLIRHGVTDSLEKRLFAGRSDIPLNRKGLSQVETLASRPDIRDIELRFSSPLSRCRQTAMAAFPGRKMIYDDRLSEIDFGLWEMKSWEEISFRWPHDTEKWASPENRFVFLKVNALMILFHRVRTAASDLENTLSDSINASSGQ